eukprot:COSAG06_NODE_5190_length_3648_cov_3.167371_5_plen_62_part_00
MTFFSQNPGGYYSGSQLSPDGDWMLCNYQGDGARRPPFSSHFLNLKAIILPRQARDKHRKR